MVKISELRFELLDHPPYSPDLAPSAIHHLHQNDIIHRDIRASNFILSSEGDLKLIDFGSCALVKDTEGKTHSSVGSPYWMAPEVIACEQLRPYTKSCDVWSLGIMAIELAETLPPLFDIHPVRAMFRIAR
ncbi:myosin-IIIb [Trichonephila inaurata madagascariensis]|uniref:Myosin-IIIb n=1 Tax=Trichonephila inaurata madagascariensis TaxID=2747483 RepID=A0A8X6XKG7_9ARAC|nr:myosin-IIIb [Trichonephila inaurata madagascariensis]